MNLTTRFSEKILEKIRAARPSPTKIKSAKPVSGGSINRAYRLETDSGNYFLKTNHASRFPGMFEAEASGLNLLAHSKSLRIPIVYGTGKSESEAFIVMEFVQEGGGTAESPRQLGEGLAKLHRNSAENFGLDQDNYIGSLPQSNAHAVNWAEFFAAQRIEPQLRMAADGNFFSSAERKNFDRLLSRIDDIVPQEKPALIHGDLWSGNYLYDAEGKPVLIDPAVYYGHREMDIAMMHLFGGFAPEVFRSYNERFPLESGWKDRVDFHNLYPLLVHVNLFGGGYAGQVKSILRKFA